MLRMFVSDRCGTKPIQFVSLESKPLAQYVDKYVVVDRIKTGAKVQKHQCGHKTGVSSSYDIIVYNWNGGLRRVMSSVGELALWKESVLRCVF